MVHVSDILALSMFKSTNIIDTREKGCLNTGEILEAIALTIFLTLVKAVLLKSRILWKYEQNGKNYYQCDYFGCCFLERDDVF